ncbi:MAG: heavy metal-responsive transcriptional regulator [Egibacteraceae bacterium]
MRIGTLAERFGLNTKTLRYYESIGLLREPPRTPGGFRVYGEEDAERLGFIRTAQRLGLTLDDIREILAFRDQGRAPCDYVRQLLAQHAEELRHRIAEMRRLRNELRHLVARAEQLPPAANGYCRLIEHHTDP